MAENFDLIFGSSASQSYSWNDSDYQNGWQTVGDTPPTREQFDALQRRADLKAQELNNRLAPIEGNTTHDYRQPSVSCALGDIAYHSTLPTGWYLECTTAGTTGAGELVITSPSVGGTVSDGTVVWTINKAFPVTGGILTGNEIKRNVDTDRLSLFGGGSWNDGAQITLHGKNNNDPLSAGSFELMAIDSNQQNPIYLNGAATGALLWNNNDLAGSAIVAKRIEPYGYIKYASGLIVAWSIDETFNDSKVVGFPISFSTGLSPLVIVQQRNSTTDFSDFQVVNVDHTQCTILANNSNFHDVSWLAIGY